VGKPDGWHRVQPDGMGPTAVMEIPRRMPERDEHGFPNFPETIDPHGCVLRFDHATGVALVWMPGVRLTDVLGREP
jgi:hypothetical protein